MTKTLTDELGSVMVADQMAQTRRAVSILNGNSIGQNNHSHKTSLTLHQYGDEKSPSRERVMFAFRKTFPNKLVLQVKILVNDNN